MPTAVILSNCLVPSWKVMADYFAKNFQEAGVTVAEEPLPVTPAERQALKAKYPGAIFFHNTVPAPGRPLTDPACVPDVKWHHLGYRSDAIGGARNILLPQYEFSQLPAPWVSLYNRYDEIWTATNHVADLLKKSGVTRPILRLPPALDRELPAPKTDYQTPAASHRPFRFLFIGEPTFRKGVHFLMYGFLKAFPRIGEAELIIKTSPTKDWVSLREDIKIITDRLPTEELQNLYRTSDCYISSSLAEGLGLPIAEAALIGLPICANNWGGHTDLLTKGGYFPLKFIEADRPWTGAPQFYTPGQKCALSDENAVAKAMLSIVKSSPARRRRLAQRAREHIIPSYGAEALKPLWAQQVNRLWNLKPAADAIPQVTITSVSYVPQNQNSISPTP